MNCINSVVRLCLLFITGATMMVAQADEKELDTLKNYQVNTASMVSSGLPTAKQFEVLQSLGVTRVVDLIPGDRQAEKELVGELGLDYHNIQVDWDHPTVANFEDYVAFMAASDNQDMTLTHCKLNWRGAVFTYLYRVTQGHEDEAQARDDLMAVWQPNNTWLRFIDRVKQHYQTNSDSK